MMDLSQVTVSLPTGDGFGWGICGDHLSAGLAKYGARTLVSEFPNGNYRRVDSLVHLQAIASHDFSYASNVVTDRAMVGYGFIENDILAAKYIPLARRLWDGIVCGSTWMQDRVGDLFAIEESYRSAVVLQGIDPALFYYTEPEDSDVFVVGSFGKFEYRKAQDTVIKAFSLFLQRHKDVRLLHCWGNRWPKLALEMCQMPVKCWMPTDGSFYGNSHAVSTGDFFNVILDRNGIDAAHRDGYMNVPYSRMRELYAMCDVAVFPNRNEAGQNLCVSEALATGLPCIVADSTGQQDLTRADGYPCDDLTLEGGVPFIHRVGDVEVGHWVEPCLEEIVSQLSSCYMRRAELRARRRAIAEWGARFTWQKSVDDMARVLKRWC